MTIPAEQQACFNVGETFYVIVHIAFTNSYYSAYIVEEDVVTF